MSGWFGGVGGMKLTLSAYLEPAVMAANEIASEMHRSMRSAVNMVG